MAEDLDLDRIISDPAYRRRMIARLNGPAAEDRSSAHQPSDHRPSGRKPPRDRSAPPPRESAASD